MAASFFLSAVISGVHHGLVFMLGLDQGIASGISRPKSWLIMSAAVMIDSLVAQSCIWRRAPSIICVNLS